MQDLQDDFVRLIRAITGFCLDLHLSECWKRFCFTLPISSRLGHHLHVDLDKWAFHSTARVRLVTTYPVGVRRSWRQRRRYLNVIYLCNRATEIWDVRFPQQVNFPLGFRPIFAGRKLVLRSTSQLWRTLQKTFLGNVTLSNQVFRPWHFGMASHLVANCG
ncbi:hypothetical protein Hypma_007076 [Hypsizygus marmoreus]|uniref:Uncharacterized protein n=1 Tax=Hypsizygus marmoreus TaxID=39966 RepID=A0A369K8R9_HYPMA|nr:hypothetical protein Hypma_007076 [Hypsizygus marmoreus]